jgi:hypothetical protein
MSYFVDHPSSLALYEAPKNGGTTLRLWLAYRLTGQLFLSSRSSNYYTGTAEMTRMLNEAGYSHEKFKQTECLNKICIMRDPVQRFVSCYMDKIVKEGKMNIGISEFLDRFDDVMTQDNQIVEAYGTSKLDFHFRPQAFHFGQDMNYYTHVFTVNQISTGLKDFLENHWRLELPDIHARNSQELKECICLSKEDEVKIRNLYAIDYQAGWGGRTW